MKGSPDKLFILILLGIAMAVGVGYVLRLTLPAPSPVPAAAPADRQIPPATNQAATSSLAPEPKQVQVSADEGPGKRLEALQLAPPPQKSVPAVLPKSGIDTKNPPQWTPTLALAPAQPTPPNPFTEPPMAVNPERQPPAPGPRHSAGVFHKVP